ncbi:MAG: hypothetical protein KAI53_01890 [Candidatus Aenigmarchaeota archaeon]|nr:hypothetical protein [Candidatus Aenigmarchaeota archaeon]
MGRTLNVSDQFIGRYSLKNQEYGFDLNILETENSDKPNEDFFEGVFKDDFGYAVASGSMDAQSVYFSIKYSDRATSMGAPGETLQYSGQSKIPGIFKGTYNEKETDTTNKPLGTFSMTRPSMTKID